MLACSFLSSAHEAFIETSTNTSGIYFDPIGSVKLIDGYLSVVIPIDISYMEHQIKNLNGVIDTSKLLCKQSALYTDIECLKMHQPLLVRYNDIIRDFESISHLIEFRSKRSAWISGVGTVFKHLFGTMDENDAIQYSKAIETIENDQTQLAKLVKENILVTTSSLSSAKETLNKFNANEQQLNYAIDALSRSQHNLSLLSDNLYLKSKINEILNTIESTLLALSFKLEDVINGIMFSKTNILYPSIITPKQLFNELVENYRFIADYHQFPVSISLENIYIIMNVSEMAAYYYNNKIIFVLKLPLVNTKIYNLYHNIPYPVSVINNTYTTIIPSIKYLAITRDRSYYCRLDNLSSCKLLNKFDYICTIPNVYSSLTTPICESEIFSKVLKYVPLNCKTKFLQGHLEIWQPLSNNKWIYVITNPSKISIDCESSNIKELIISGTGILNLPIDCIAYYKDSRLIPKNTKVINLRPIITNFNLLNDSCCNSEKLLKSKSYIHTYNLTNINLDSISSQHNVDINHIITELDGLIKKPHIVLYGQYYSYTTIIICIIIIIIVLIFGYKYFVKSGKCRNIFNKNKNNISNTEELSEAVESARIPISLPRIRTTVT